MNRPNFLLILFVGTGFATAASTSAFAEETRRELPKWEAGIGFGYVGFEHYPSSNQVTHLALPFPAFQYRGDVLRADDREGAKVYLVKRHGWDLQLGGLGFPPLASSTNEARRGMEDLPALGALGPQLVRSLNDEATLKFGVYQAVAATWLALRPAGGLWEVSVSYQKAFDLRGRNGFWGVEETSVSLAMNVIGASQEVHNLYFTVPAGQATSDRPAYNARAGILESQVSYFQSFKRGNFTFYVGARISDYSLSASRESPLHKVDHTVAGLLGLTYTLYQSKQTGVPDREAAGALDKLRRDKK